MIDIKPITSITDVPEIHKAFVSAVVQSIETHIKKLGVIKGLVIRNAYAAVKAIRPGYVEHVIEVLSRDYVREFDDMHQQYREEQHLPAEKIQPLTGYIQAHQQDAEERFWRVSDGYAKSRSGTFIGKTYQALRPQLKSHLPTVFEVIFTLIDQFTVVKS
jgi:hypothetical protein